MLIPVIESSYDSYSILHAFYTVDVREMLVLVALCNIAWPTL